MRASHDVVAPPWWTVLAKPSYARDEDDLLVLTGGPDHVARAALLTLRDLRRTALVRDGWIVGPDGVRRRPGERALTLTCPVLDNRKPRP